MVDKKRWKSNYGLAYIENLKEIISNGGKIHLSPFGLINNYNDLQGIILPDNSKFSNVDFQNIDLSESRIKNAWIEKSQFNNCFFYKANLEYITEHENLFKGCNFIKTSFKKGVIGFKGSKFENCFFEKVNFNGTGFICAEFNNCIFRDCNLTLIDFNASSFENCNFEGLLKDTWFRGGYKFKQDINEFGIPKINKMKNVSFLKAQLTLVNFNNNCDLSTVILPENGKYIKITNWKSNLEKIYKKNNYLSDKDRRELDIFYKVHSVYAATQNDYILNYQDLVEEYGDNVADYIWCQLQ